jgi:hypothetical protein
VYRAEAGVAMGYPCTVITKMLYRVGAGAFCQCTEQEQEWLWGTHVPTNIMYSVGAGAFFQCTEKEQTCKFIAYLL